MHPQCLPFTKIPQTTALFSAFLYDFPRVQRFFRRLPNEPSWFADEAATITYDPQRRAAVADILARQNRTFGCSEKTLANIERLRRGACALITGQQAGLFGGPLFSVLKAVTAIHLAARASAQAVECVPVFWLATEDHDLAEVDNVVLPAGDGSLRKLTAIVDRREHAPISDASFTSQIDAVVAESLDLLGDSEAAGALRASYRPGISMGDAFGKFFACVFRDFGVVLLDASDPDLHVIAAPLYAQAAHRSRELCAALMARGRELHDSGFHEQVKVTPSSTLLFTLHEGARTPIHRTNERFAVADQKWSEADLAARIAESPERFSANVLLRPVVQDYLLPTLAYVGGPAEVAYFAQAAVVYEQLLGRVTPILPRFSATLVEPHANRLLHRYQLEPADLFGGAEQVRRLLAERSLPSDLHRKFAEADAALDRSLQGIIESLDHLDHTLVDAANRASAKMRYQLNRLRTRAAHAELRRNEVLDRHARQFAASLYPHDTLQERVIGGIYFLARYPDLLDTLTRAAAIPCAGHQVINL
ncbi:MAG: bacillithiol biosynthesis cysteine-adding enzyme BshC [Terriglobales bacterium]